jgi:hypothetical protein
MDGTSDQAASNWGNVYTPGDPNNVPLAARTSIRATAHADGDLRHPVLQGRRRRVVFYSGTSGRPYTLTYNNDANGDNRSRTTWSTSQAHRPVDLHGRHLQRSAHFLQATVPGEYIGQIIRATPAARRGRTRWTAASRAAALQALQGRDHARRR